MKKQNSRKVVHRNRKIYKNRNFNDNKLNDKYQNIKSRRKSDGIDAKELKQFIRSIHSTIRGFTFTDSLE